ncbi:hypothetical protein DIPPA_24518 [Diplonema papillatum]|nr:hypothetical protein DIPPA_24518 [Diplonema papillatum]
MQTIASHSNPKVPGHVAGSASPPVPPTACPPWHPRGTGARPKHAQQQQPPPAYTPPPPAEACASSAASSASSNAGGQTGEGLNPNATEWSPVKPRSFPDGVAGGAAMQQQHQHQHHPGGYPGGYHAHGGRAQARQPMAPQAVTLEEWSGCSNRAVRKHFSSAPPPPPPPPPAGLHNHRMPPPPPPQPRGYPPFHHSPADFYGPNQGW